MKRSREVSIIVNALTESGLLDLNRSDRARCVVKEAIKEIRREQYREQMSRKRGGVG